MSTQFGTNTISQYDYISDELAQRTSMTTSGTAIDTMPQPTVPEQDITYTTNEFNQYTSLQSSVSSIQLSYDLDRNLIEDNIHHFTYDAENRLTSVTPITPTTGSTKVEFAYDYMSRWVQKQVSTYDGSSWVLETEKSFVYDGWNLIKEQTTGGGNTSTDYYVWGLDLSGTLHGAGGIGGLLMRKSDTGTFLYLYDANGNVEQLVNNHTGEVAARYKYSPFGELLMADGPEAENNLFRFSTKCYDIETGLYYYGFRYYDPVSGRWWTRDPIGGQGRANLYNFVRNTPINAIDLFGLLSDENEALLRNLPSISAKSPIAEIETVVRTLIAVARKEGYHVAAEHLEHYLNGSGTSKTISTGWLKGFPLVKEAELRVQEHHQRDLVKKAKKMKRGEVKKHRDHWEGAIDYGFVGVSDEELFWASGGSLLTGYGDFTLKRKGCGVEIEGIVTFVWSDSYDFHEDLGVYIPGYGRVPDAALLKLETHGAAKSFAMNAEWRKQLLGRVKLWLFDLFATAKWTWSDL